MTEASIISCSHSITDFRIKQWVSWITSAKSEIDKRRKGGGEGLRTELNSQVVGLTQENSLNSVLPRIWIAKFMSLRCFSYLIMAQTRVIILLSPIYLHRS